MKFARQIEAAKKEQYPHDVCPLCGTGSVPAEAVVEQAFRFCPQCLYEWFEDFNDPARTVADTTHE